LKGASDGGLYVPHNEKRFPGYDIESKELDAEVLQKYIVGGHVAEYMESLEEEDDERFKKQFATYLADGVGSDDIEEIYSNAYAAIREDPEFKPSEKDTAKWTAESKKYRTAKLSKEQRDTNIEKKIAAYKAGAAEGSDDEE
jgi:large subunit ribosomal protein L5e